MTPLEKITGPACPRCGCAESAELDRRRGWDGRDQVVRRCGACAHRFTSAEDPPAKRNGKAPAQADPDPDPDAGVVFHVLRCPKCHSDKVRTHTTRRPLRYHLCPDCGLRFKSIES